MKLNDYAKTTYDGTPDRVKEDQSNGDNYFKYAARMSKAEAQAHKLGIKLDKESGKWKIEGNHDFVHGIGYPTYLAVCESIYYPRWALNIMEDVELGAKEIQKHYEGCAYETNFFHDDTNFNIYIAALKQIPWIGVAKQVLVRLLNDPDYRLMSS